MNIANYLNIKEIMKRKKKKDLMKINIKPSLKKTRIIWLKLDLIKINKKLIQKKIKKVNPKNIIIILIIKNLNQIEEKIIIKKRN